MGLFSSGRTLGVDVGTSKLKVVELKKAKGGKAELSTYGMARLPDDLVRADSDEIVGKIMVALQKIVERAEMKAKRVYASLPGFSVFSQEIVLPAMSKSKLAAAVEQEAGKHVPGDLADMVLDWEVIEEALHPGAQAHEDQIRVLLTAAPKTLVDRYSRIFKGAGLELVSLETEAMALVRSIIGRDRTPTLVVDLGSTATDIIIVHGAMPRFTRTIDVGGLAMTQAMAKGMQVSFDQAEQMKKDVGLGAVEGGQIPAGLRPAIGEILGEIRTVGEAFAKESGHDVERIVLAGGAAKLKGFDRVVEAETGVTTAVGNPFARVLHPTELDTVLKGVGPDLSVAIGLSMKEIY